MATGKRLVARETGGKGLGRCTFEQQLVAPSFLGRIG